MAFSVPRKGAVATAALFKGDDVLRPNAPRLAYYSHGATYRIYFLVNAQSLILPCSLARGLRM